MRLPVPPPPPDNRRTDEERLVALEALAAEIVARLDRYLETHPRNAR